MVSRLLVLLVAVVVAAADKAPYQAHTQHETPKPFSYSYHIVQPHFQTHVQSSQLHPHTAHGYGPGYGYAPVHLLGHGGHGIQQKPGGLIDENHTDAHEGDGSQAKPGYNGYHGYYGYHGAPFPLYGGFKPAHYSYLPNYNRPFGFRPPVYQPYGYGSYGYKPYGHGPYGYGGYHHGSAYPYGHHYRPKHGFGYSSSVLHPGGHASHTVLRPAGYSSSLHSGGHHTKHADVDVEEEVAEVEKSDSE